MKKHLDIFRALVAFVVVGTAASRSLQTQGQIPQRDFGGQGPGLDVPGSFGSGIGGVGGGGSGGPFDGGFDGRSHPGGIVRGGGAGAGMGGMGTLGGMGSIGPGGVGGLGGAPRNGGSGVFPGGPDSPTGTGGGLGGDFNEGFGSGPRGGIQGAGGFGRRLGGPGLLGGSGRPSSLPGLEGTSGPAPDVISSTGGGMSDLGSRGSPSIGTAGMGLISGSGTLGAGAGTPGAQEGPLGGSGRSPGSLGSPSSSGFPEGGPSLESPREPSGPRFGSGSGISGAGQPGPGVSQPASAGGNGGLGTIEAPFGGSSGLPSGASSAGGIMGPGSPGLTASGTLGGGPRPEGRNPSGRGTSAIRPGGKRHRKPLTEAEKAAIGLGVSGGLLAIGALGAAIASAVHQSQRQRHRSQGPNTVRPGAGFGPCQKPQCRSGCGRQRRSTQESKVPAEILDNIQMKFQQLH